MKKILLLFLMIFTSFSFTSFKNVNANFTPDEKVNIILTKDQNVIHIEHNTDYVISHAITEYVRLENGIYVSRLDEFTVNNNKFSVPAGTTAVKVHQVKTLINKIYYRYATSNSNSIGSFTDVTRMNIAEIKTTAVEVVKTKYKAQGRTQSPNFRYFEFYFNFDKEHDHLVSVDVDYIMKKYALWGTILTDTFNVTENIDTGIKEVQVYQEKTSVMNNVIYEPINLDIKGLERNSSSNAGDYVVRVAPSDLKYFETSYHIDNFAIIRIEYSIDGEFFIDDVLNDPVTPDNPNSGLIGGALDSIFKFFDAVREFFTGNSSIILKVLTVFVILILYTFFSPVIKLLWLVIKLIYKSLTNLVASIFGIFFR